MPRLAATASRTAALTLRQDDGRATGNVIPAVTKASSAARSPLQFPSARRLAMAVRTLAVAGATLTAALGVRAATGSLLVSPVGCRAGSIEPRPTSRNNPLNAQEILKPKVTESEDAATQSEHTFHSRLRYGPLTTGVLFGLWLEDSAPAQPPQPHTPVFSLAASNPGRRRGGGPAPSPCPALSRESESLRR